jgi:basic membrane protein A and related proteins
MPRLRARYLALAALLLVLVPTLAACGGTSSTGGGTTSKKIKVGLVTDIGGLNDRGFNHSAYVGLQKAITDFHIQGDVKESHSPNDYVSNLTQFAGQGYDLVIAVGFLMQTAVGTVSASFPNVHFAIIDGDATDASGTALPRTNVEGLHFKEQEAGALVGVIAGMLEKNGTAPKHQGTISAVGGLPIPPVNHYIAGYQWGAKQELSTVKVVVGYSNDFTDPTKCHDVANNQIGGGADIVFQVAGGCGLGALQAAGEKGVYSIGVDLDQKDSDKSVIASALKRVDTAAYDAIKDVVNNQFQGGAVTFSLANGGVDFAPGNIALPSDITAEVTRIEGQIKSGAVTVPDTIQS